MIMNINVNQGPFLNIVATRIIFISKFSLKHSDL